MQGLLVLTTLPDAKSAKKIASILVSKKLAACVSMKQGWVSIYRWKGKTERSSETLLLIKTVRRRLTELQKTLCKLHPYELPEFLVLPAGGSKEYLAWMNENTR